MNQRSSQSQTREAPPRWPRGRRGESRACRGSRPRGVGVGDVELVDRLIEGEKGVELLARDVEVEVCRLEEGKGTEYLLHGGAEYMVGAHELVGQPVSCPLYLPQVPTLAARCRC